MKKIIRSTYPAQFSIGLLVLIFVMAYLLSYQVFDVRLHELQESREVYFGMFLVSFAVIIMVLIMWEEILFPIKLKKIEGGGIFRNHRKKLKLQLLIYSVIPVIFIFIYVHFDINYIRFIIWAAVCMIPPAVEKIFSGIRNYNDYLTLTDKSIVYKNNEKQGEIFIKDVLSIVIIKDDRTVMSKIQLTLTNNEKVTIDLDEMELEAFYDPIYTFLVNRYSSLLKESKQL